MFKTEELLTLQPMTEHDLDRVMAIEERAYPYPWTRSIFSDCLKHNYHCLLHEQNQDIIAYGVISVAVEEMHILNLTVTPDRQHQGLGKRLLNTLEMIGRGLDAKECFLEVRPSNTSAIRLYLSHGFNELGLRKNYYPAKQGREHAVLMAKTFFAEE
jgi:ribosomal-protein-alanine N-acetyltransferase